MGGLLAAGVLAGDVVEDLRTWMHEYAALSATSENVVLVRALAAAADALIGATLYRMLSVTTSVDDTIGRYELIDILMSGLSI